MVCVRLSMKYKSSFHITENFKILTFLFELFQVVVLDRNSESYINLRYPVLAPPPPLCKAQQDSEVCATSFKIKFEDSV
jgi:hypothetical protein